jgi:hypothetical protein
MMGYVNRVFNFSTLLDGFTGTLGPLQPASLAALQHFHSLKEYSMLICIIG